MSKRIPSILFLLLSLSFLSYGQEFTVHSPDNHIVFKVFNQESLEYSVEFRGETIISRSPLGFEFSNEPPLGTGLVLLESKPETHFEVWEPVVKSKHASITDHHNSLYLKLRESKSPRRELGFTVKCFNDGVAFAFELYRSERIGQREITAEKTSFTIPGDPKAWIVEYGGYASSNEAEFYERKLSYLNEKSIAGLPLLMEYDPDCWVAITEANIDNYAAFYAGTDGNQGRIHTKLVPLPGQNENGVKVRSDDDIKTPWRVIMIGDSPGTLIESEIIQNLNEACAIEDPSWIRPGMSAWDHWWSGEVKMEMPVIRQYIDFAAEMGWEYMLVDWQWYGEFNKPEADITKWAPQIDLPEIISYAKSKNVDILIWLYSTDVNRNSAYKKAFPLYHEWGIAGVKIDFMDRDDQDMVNWYHDIIQCAAENKLLVDFHGAYKPDGIIRTWPNMITREGVMGNEYYKFSDKMSPEHNVKLAFTRMLAGQMDYTPGGFLNVTREQFRQQTPALVWNTRAAELSKFVIYESPLTVFCDHPDHVLEKPGADFLKKVPTTWDDTRFLGGYPGEFISLARRNGDTWYVGVLNNGTAKTIEINTGFLGDGTYESESWADNRKSVRTPSELTFTKKSGIRPGILKINLAPNGGYVATFSPEKGK